MSISVIIPNFNYARFLPRRIDSIVNQTIPPDEIIFLDDASTDESVAVAEKILSKSSIPYRIFANKTNQGVFSQWLKGIELVKHDLFWIAEADDYCETTFLEHLLPAFDDEKVILSYCQSNIVNGAQTDSPLLSHENFAPYVDIDYFMRDHITSAKTVLQDYVTILNTISNASAVVIRKSACDLNILMPIKDYVYAGDWLFNLLLLRSNEDRKIAFTARNLNYWVYHPNSVWAEAPENANRRYAGSCEVIRIYLDLFSQQHQPSPKQRLQMLKLIYDAHLKYILDQPEESLFETLCEKGCGPELGSQIAGFLIDAKRTEEKVERLQLKCGAKNRSLTQLTRHIANVNASLSWRITKPLRFIHDLFMRDSDKR